MFLGSFIIQILEYIFDCIIIILNYCYKK